MGIIDVAEFKNIGWASFLIGFLAFMITYSVLVKFIRSRGSALVASLAIFMMAGWYLYTKGLLEQDKILVTVMILLVIAVLVKIGYGFLRWIGISYGRH